MGLLGSHITRFSDQRARPQLQDFSAGSEHPFTIATAFRPGLSSHTRKYKESHIARDHPEKHWL